MKRKIALWTLLIVLAGAGVYALLRNSDSGVTPGNSLATPSPPTFSLIPGSTGLLNGGVSYVLDYNYVAADDVLSLEELIAPIGRYLDQQGNTDLMVGQLREFSMAYEAEIVERSTGRHAFGVMLGKGTRQISPKVGPNVFWNTRYGSRIAEIGGGYGMIGRLLSQEAYAEVTLNEVEARQIAERALKEVDAVLKLDNDVAAYYGFYEFYVIREEALIGEIDVNVYTNQVWYKEWGEPQLDVVDLNVDN